MNLERLSLVVSAATFYGITGLVMLWEGNDYLYGYYSIFLGLFSGLYHYNDERRFFAEDFVCSFFYKLHVLTNYVLWVGWRRFLFYSFFSEIVGHIIFYLSFWSWKYKNRNYAYMIVHNIWHIYTGLMPYIVVRREDRVDLGFLDSFFMLCFVLSMSNYNLKNHLCVNGVIMGSFYLWNIGNFYNLTILGLLHFFYCIRHRLIFW